MELELGEVPDFEGCFAGLTYNEQAVRCHLPGTSVVGVLIRREGPKTLFAITVHS